MMYRILKPGIQAYFLDTLTFILRLVDYSYFTVKDYLFHLLLSRKMYFCIYNIPELFFWERFIIVLKKGKESINH